MPATVSDQMWKAALLVPHSAQPALTNEVHLPAIRLAIRQSRKVAITYSVPDDRVTERIIWPLGLYLFSHLTLICNWCELRRDYRTFRADRIAGCRPLEDRFDPKGGAMLKACLAGMAAE